MRGSGVLLDCTVLKKWTKRNYGTFKNLGRNKQTSSGSSGIRTHAPCAISQSGRGSAATIPQQRVARHIPKVQVR
jgi:hypothetical protein